jgi:hypothetical protein
MGAQAALAAEQGTERWVFEAYATLFVPTSISGMNEFPPEESSPPDSTDIGASNSLVTLNGAFIGGFTARRDRWGVYTNVIYVDLHGTQTGSNVIEIAGQPTTAATTATARLGMRDSYVFLAGLYRVVANPNSPVDLLVGARFFDQHRALDWQFSGNVGSIPTSELSGNRSVSQSGVDAVLGLTGRFGPTGHGWFAPYYVDFGTGKSSLTFQANAGFGYGWSCCEAALGWRYMHFGNPASSNIESVNLNGPALVLLVRW